MIDFHSHILPGIDDGSKDSEESLEMLKLLRMQGISKVVATPHFYVNHNSVDEFLNKRSEAYATLNKVLNDGLPEIILGAEVKYYEGISRLDNLSKLRIGDSKLLLLEMSMRKWTEYTLRELISLSSSGDMIVVLAHIERYLRLQSKDVIETLVNNGVLIQTNADFFISSCCRRKAIRMLKDGLIHFIGSDCHNLFDRPPKIGEAITYIERKAGKELLMQLNDFAERFL